MPEFSARDTQPGGAAPERYNPAEIETKWQALWEAKSRLRHSKDESGKPKYTTRDWAAWVLTGNPD